MKPREEHFHDASRWLHETLDDVFPIFFSFSRCNTRLSRTFHDTVAGTVIYTVNTAMTHANTFDMYYNSFQVPHGNPACWSQAPTHNSHCTRSQPPTHTIHNTPAHTLHTHTLSDTSANPLDPAQCMTAQSAVLSW